jgi:hypothetical protein
MIDNNVVGRVWVDGRSRGGHNVLLIIILPRVGHEKARSWCLGVGLVASWAAGGYGFKVVKVQGCSDGGNLGRIFRY